MKQNDKILCKPLKASELMPYIDLMSEYFGLGASYFDTSLQVLYSRYHTTGKPIPDDKDTDTLLQIHINWEHFIKLVDTMGITYETHHPIYEMLYILANLIYDKKYGEVIERIEQSEWEDSFAAESLQYDIIRKDMLNLYLFINNPDNHLYKELSIKHFTGIVKLENRFGWFTKRLLKDYLAKYLPDITTVQQAEEELKLYRATAGRKYADEREMVLTYGIYKLFHDNVEMDSDLPNNLCQFIFDYLKLIKVYDDNVILGESEMRAKIRYIIKKPVQPKFPLDMKMEECTADDMNTRLNEQMF